MSDHFLTLSLTNRFAFTCPVMDAQVEMRTCVLLRDKVYKGQLVETRRGCQACISGGLCPAAELVRRIAFKAHTATDHCSSEEPKVGKLPADVLERIVATVVPDSALQHFAVPDAETLRIKSARARIEAQIGAAPRAKVEGRITRSAAAPKQAAHSTEPKAAPKAEPIINKAAATGDLAAALNAA